MRVFLVRHGQSESNADWNVNTTKADHAIELTDEGMEQARGAGEFLRDLFSSEITHGTAGAFFNKVRLWHSPYVRTRQTASQIVAACRTPEDIQIRRCRPGPGVIMLDNVAKVRKAGESFFVDDADPDAPVPHGREHLLLHEQQFGLFDGLSDEERAARYPDEWAHYRKVRKFEGKMFAKMPMGESRADVCMRVHQAFGSFHRDAERHGIEDIVVVGHGTTNRSFLTMWLHKRWEWMHEEPNPKNCSVRLIEDKQDRGYIFEGYENPEGYKHAARK
jgi:2,3-bisphosphoglycerate-dependent phosphoglycerate mutase